MPSYLLFVVLLVVFVSGFVRKLRFAEALCRFPLAIFRPFNYSANGHRPSTGCASMATSGLPIFIYTNLRAVSPNEFADARHAEQTGPPTSASSRFTVDPARDTPAELAA